MPHRGFEYGSAFLAWLPPLVTLVLLVGGIVLLVLAIRRKPTPPLDADPLRRAAMRYAGGEIERVEFERIQRDLEGPGDDPLRQAALRLARGEITVEQFDAVRTDLGATPAQE